jgi:MoxR-like ATPase
VDGRDFALPDDVKSIAVACLAHRMVVNPENAMGGETTISVVEELLKQDEVPFAVD